MEAAKRAFDSGRYGEAVKLLKQALKDDRTSYEGFVLLGLALVRSGQHLEQGEMSFKKAITLDSAALPAYKGLLELRESSGTSEQVLEAREAALKAARAAGDAELAMELARRLAATHSSAGNHESVKGLWEEILRIPLSQSQRLEALCSLVDAEAALMEANIDDIHRRQALETHLVDITEQLPHQGRFQELLLKMILQRLRSSSGSELVQVKKQAVSRCLLMLSTCPTPMVVDLLVTLFEENGVEETFQELEDVTDAVVWAGKRIAHLYPGRGFAVLPCLRKERRKSMIQVELSADENSIAGWRKLAELQAEEGLAEEAWTNISRALARIARARNLYGLSLRESELKLNIIQGNLLLSRRSYVEALNLFRKTAKEAQVLEGRSRRSITGAALKGLVELFTTQGETGKAQATLQNMLSVDARDHWALSERGWLAFQNNAWEEATADLDRAVSLCPESATYHYRLGRCCWSTGTKERAIHEFMESARINPREADPFIFLGHYYAEDDKDPRRASRCYRKAVDLDPENEVIGEALCDMLDSRGQFEMEKEVCLEASQKSHRAFWAWRRLGFIQTDQKEWPQAITALQFSLRHYTTEANLWEALGLCYKKLGMFTAALKACARAFDIDSSSLFATIEMGNIHLQLSAYLKAIHAYRQALSITPHDQSALYGLAAALICQAREYCTLGAFSSASELLKEAMGLAGKFHGHFGAIWKQLGDANLLYAQTLPCELRTDDLEDVLNRVRTWCEERRSAAAAAVRAFKHAVHLLPAHAPLYSDLSFALELAGDIEEKKQDISSWSRAEAIICGGVQLDGGNADLWATLGIVSKHKGLKQHAFIQALRLNGTHAVAWSFLGQLYFKTGEEELARHCFDRARTGDPTSALPWAGMAAMTKSVPAESFSSCSYALYLASTLELQTCLGQLAAETRKLNLPQVYLALEQATKTRPLQAEAHNLKGLSCESRGDLQSAIVSYRTARAVAALSVEAVRDLAITSNYARALCKAQHYDAAAKEYKKLLDAGALREPGELLGYAISLWHSSDQKQVAESFTKEALAADFPSNAKRACAVALYVKLLCTSRGPAAAVEALAGVSDALFLELQLALTTIMLGIYSCKPETLSTAIRKCSSIFTAEQAPEANLLLAQGSQIHNPAGVVRNLIKAVHAYPNSHSLRAKLGESLLSQSHGMASNLVGRLCRTEGICSSSKRLTTITLTDSSISGSIGTLDSSEVLSQLQKLVHQEPDNVVARYCLSLLLMHRARTQKYPPHLCQVVVRTSSQALQRLSSSEAHCFMRTQLQLCIAECKLQIGDFWAAVHVAKAVAEGSSAEGKTAAILQLARGFTALGDHASATAAVLSYTTSALVSGFVVSQLLLLDLKLLLQLPGNDEAVARLRQVLESDSSQLKNRWLALLDFLLGRKYLRTGDLQAAEAAAAKALTCWVDNPILQLFHGAISMELVKSGKGNLLPKAIASLAKAVQGKKRCQVPVACALLAQAESSRDGARASSVRRWAANMRSEFLTWPQPESRPAELYYQMSLVSKQAMDGEDCPESAHSCKGWLQRALHINPACPKYWAMSKQFVSEVLTH